MDGHGPTGMVESLLKKLDAKHIKTDSVLLFCLILLIQQEVETNVRTQPTPSIYDKSTSTCQFFLRVM